MYESTDPNHPANVALNVVKSHMNSGGHSWVITKTGCTGDWCAATMVAMGVDAGLAGTVFPKSNEYYDRVNFQGGIYHAGGIGESIVKNHGGTRIDGPAWGKSATPAPGDLIIFLWDRDNFRKETIAAYNAGNKKRYWSGSHVGVVESAKDGKVYYIEGNNGTNIGIGRNSKSLNCVNIAFYARPDWSKADGAVAVTYATTGTYYEDESDENQTSTYQSETGSYTTQLFRIGSTKGYASIREVAFMDSTGQPSINTSGVKLAVINYTGLLKHLYYTKVDSEGNTYYSTTPYNGDSTNSTNYTASDNLDNLDPVPRAIVQFFLDKGYNTAAAIGIAANIKASSNFKTNAVSNNGSAFGLCQWTGTYAQEMKARLGDNWANNLTGQLNYLSDTLDSTFAYLKSELKSVPNTQAGAEKAADLFVRQYNSPADVETASENRKKYADKLWKDAVVESTAESANYSKDHTVKKLSTDYGDLYLVWPIASVPVGTYTSKWGDRTAPTEGATTNHDGVDIGAKEGTPIKCCAPGKIYRKRYTSARGYYVVVDHGKQHWTVYQHMQGHSPLAEGTKVNAGQVIGYVGQTGISSGPHLHLEVHEKTLLTGTGSGSNYVGTSDIDPAQFFPGPSSKS